MMAIFNYEPWRGPHFDRFYGEGEPRHPGAVTVTGTSDNTAALTPVHVHGGAVDCRKVAEDEVVADIIRQPATVCGDEPRPWTSRDWDRLKGIVGAAALLAFYLRDWIWGLVA